MILWPYWDVNVLLQRIMSGGCWASIWFQGYVDKASQALTLLFPSRSWHGHGDKSWICGIKVDSFKPIEDKYTIASLKKQFHWWMTESIHVFIGPENVPVLDSAFDLTFTHEHVHLERKEQEKAHVECELKAIDHVQSFMIILSFMAKGSSKIISIFLVETQD